MRLVLDDQTLDMWAKEYRTRMMDTGFAAWKQMTFEDYINHKIHEHEKSRSSAKRTA